MRSCARARGRSRTTRVSCPAACAQLEARPAARPGPRRLDSSACFACSTASSVSVSCTAWPAVQRAEDLVAQQPPRRCAGQDRRGPPIADRPLEAERLRHRSGPGGRPSGRLRGALRRRLLLLRGSRLHAGSISDDRTTAQEFLINRKPEPSPRRRAPDDKSGAVRPRPFRPRGRSTQAACVPGGQDGRGAHRPLTPAGDELARNARGAPPCVRTPATGNCSRASWT